LEGELEILIGRRCSICTSMWRSCLRISIFSKRKNNSKNNRKNKKRLGKKEIKKNERMINIS